MFQSYFRYRAVSPRERGSMTCSSRRSLSKWEPAAPATIACRSRECPGSLMRSATKRIEWTCRFHRDRQFRQEEAALGEASGGSQSPLHQLPPASCLREYTRIGRWLTTLLVTGRGGGLKMDPSIRRMDFRVSLENRCGSVRSNGQLGRFIMLLLLGYRFRSDR